MPECPNCHEYYFGTPDECPKCHKKIPSTENNTPSVKQHKPASERNLTRNAVEKSAAKKVKHLLVIPLIYYVWCLCSYNWPRFSMNLQTFLMFAGLICTLIVFVAASKEQNELGAVKLLLLVPIIDLIWSLIDWAQVIYYGAMFEIRGYISLGLCVISFICTMVAFFRGGFGFAQVKEKINDTMEKRQYTSGGLSGVSSVMFSNIGRKIKTLAKVVCWIGIIGSVIGGIVMFATMGSAGVLSGILTIVLGALISWIGSFVLYGFGEMVENSDIRTELAVKAATEKQEE